MIKQDDHQIKCRTNVRLSFKRLRSIATAILGIALMDRIRMGHFNLANLGFQDSR